MSAYIKLSTLEYPRHEGDIRLEHPEIREDQTWPNFPCPDTYALVNAVPIPEYNFATQRVEELQPTQVDGIWTQQFLVRDMTEQELQLRAEKIAELQQASSQT
jgi:hypothetical protein